MTILIEQQLPERGTFQINTTVTIEVSAQEALRKVDRWLLESISTMVGADEPMLSVGSQTVWSVPVYFGAPHIGRVGQVGTVEVNVLSGKLLNLTKAKTKIGERTQVLADTLSPFHLRSAADKYLATTFSSDQPITPPSGSPFDIANAKQSND